MDKTVLQVNSISKKKNIQKGFKFSGSKKCKLNSNLHQKGKILGLEI